MREPLNRWAEAGRAAGVATLVRVRGSAPRRPGARFAASEEGELAGSISRGCVESDLHEQIGLLFAGEGPRLLHYGITDEMALEVGLACGGEIDVLVEPHDPDDPVWPELDALVDAGGTGLLLVGLSDEIRTRRMLVRPDGERTGSLGSEPLDRRAVEAAGSLMSRGGTAVLELQDPAARIFAEAFVPPERLAIVGAGPVARHLCRFAADLGWAVTVIEPREAFGDERHFPRAERVLRTWPEEGLRAAGLDRHLRVVVVAHDQKLDVPALAAALEAGCEYVGLMGGGRTQASRREALADRGLPRTRIDAIRGPVGLEIGAETPEEIALAIAAELVATRRGALS